MTTPIAKSLGPVARTAAQSRSDLNISFEFFPPKSQAMQDMLWSSILKLESLAPKFVSVTYGAGGSTRERTHETVARIASETTLRPAAHLTCVGSTQAEIDQIADEYWQAGVRHIVALRGDPQGGVGKAYHPTEGGYAYGSDLVKGLKARNDFEISVSAYPERHPESPDWQAEIDNLKRKVDAGADRAITQFFFTPEVFLRYVDKVRAAGIDIPIVPGLMLQSNYQGIVHMASLCEVNVPDWYQKLFAGLDAEPDIRLLLTATTTAELVSRLREEGVKDFHFYTLNKADLAFMLCKILGLPAETEA